jgi:outer membrane protein
MFQWFRPARSGKCVLAATDDGAKCRLRAGQASRHLGSRSQRSFFLLVICMMVGFPGDLPAGEEPGLDVAPVAVEEASSPDEAPIEQTPLGIADAVSRILAHSPFLQASQEGVAMAGEKINEARAMRGVQVKIGVGATTVNSPLQVFGSKLNQGRVGPEDFAFERLNDPSRTQNWQVGAQIAKPLWLGGMDRHAVTAARAGVAASREELEATREQVIFLGIKTYLDVILAREAVAVAAKAVEASAESVENARAAVSAHRAVESDLLQAQVHHADNQERLLRAHNHLKLARDALATLMGESSAEHYTLTMPILAEVCSFCTDDPDELLGKALTQRPDFARVARQREASLAAARMHDAGVRPHMSVGVAVEQNRERLNGGAGKGNSLAFARVDWSLADGGAARAKSRGSRHQAAQLAKMSEALRDQIHLELRQAITAINNALERLNVSRAAVQQGRESLRILRDRYTQGLAIMSELLLAETALLGHEMNEVQAFYDYALSRAHLKHALGELRPESCDILTQQE